MSENAPAGWRKAVAYAVSALFHPSLLLLAVVYTISYPQWVQPVLLVGLVLLVLPLAAYIFSIKLLVNRAVKTSTPARRRSQINAPAKVPRLVALAFLLLGIGALLGINFNTSILGGDEVAYLLVFVAAIVLGLLLITLFYAISLHMAGIGAVSVMLYVSIRPLNLEGIFLILLPLLLANALVAWARLYTKAHNWHQVLVGFVYGTGVVLFYFFS